MAKKTTTENTEMKYYINICGKRKEVTKEEYEKRYPPIAEAAQTSEATTE